MPGYKELKNLEGRIVLITGASSGMGEQIAYQAARKGAVVVGCARRLERLEEVASTCRRLSGNAAYAFQVDVSVPSQIERVVRKVETEIGPVDVLVNDAGFGLMKEALDFDMTIAERMFRVNVLGLMYMTKYVALHMAERRRGAVINIASIAGKIATPKSSVYSATKFAVLGYSNALRLELKPLGISVLTVNPGPVRTDFFNIADESGHYLDSIGFLSLNPEIVAEKVVRSIGTSRRELNLPGYMQLAHHLYEVCPHLGDCLAGGIFNRK